MTTSNTLMDFLLASRLDPGSSKSQPVFDQSDIFYGLCDLALRIVGGHDDIDMKVVGQHTCQGNDFAVVEYGFSNGASITLSGNASGYSLSVASPAVDVPADLCEGVCRQEESAVKGFAGFPQDRLYGSHACDPQRFTLRLADRESLTSFMSAFAKLQGDEMQHRRKIEAQAAARCAFTCVRQATVIHPPRLRINVKP